MSKAKSNKTLLVAVAILLVLVVAAVTIFFVTKPKTIKGDKDITVNITLLDGVKIEYKLSTDAEYLSGVLKENSLVPQEDLDAGFVTTLNDITADSASEQWWMMTVNGEFSNYGINDLPVVDGDIYDFTLVEGWDVF